MIHRSRSLSPPHAQALNTLTVAFFCLLGGRKPFLQQLESFKNYPISFQRFLSLLSSLLSLSSLHLFSVVYFATFKTPTSFVCSPPQSTPPTPHNFAPNRR